MKSISFLIKPVSSACNFNCKYCFYHDVSEHRKIKSHGNMNEETMKVVIDRALSEEYIDITFAFQGGEPMLAGLSFYQKFTSYVEERKNINQQIHYALQTNASMINDEWAMFFHDYQFLIGVSLDGYQKNHDCFRLTKKHVPTYAIVMQAIACLRKHDVPFNILTVLSKQLAKYPKELYDFYKHEGFDFIQLIPCLSGLDETENESSLTPKLFASFYKTFYDAWLHDFQKGEYMSINLFDNLIMMYQGRMPYQCGLLGKCAPQMVIESDGSVYPCDFYVLDDYKMGNIMSASLFELYSNKQLRTFLNEDTKGVSLCKSCFFQTICHGNCKRMQHVYYTKTYCGYADFLAYAYPTMIEIAKKI